MLSSFRSRSHQAENLLDIKKDVWGSSLRESLTGNRILAPTRRFSNSWKLEDQFSGPGSDLWVCFSCSLKTFRSRSSVGVTCFRPDTSSALCSSHVHFLLLSMPKQVRLQFTGLKLRKISWNPKNSSESLKNCWSRPQDSLDHWMEKIKTMFLLVLFLMVLFVSQGRFFWWDHSGHGVPVVHVFQGQVGRRQRGESPSQIQLSCCLNSWGNKNQKLWRKLRKKRKKNLSANQTSPEKPVSQSEIT